MSDLGQFQGQWLGKWHGGLSDAPEGSMSGNATMSFMTYGTLTDANAGVDAPVVGGKPVISYQQARDEWESLNQWRERVMQWADVTPVEKPKRKKKAKPVEVPIDRLSAPVLSMAELIADARLLQIDELRALEAAMQVRDVLALAEAAYIADLAIRQEKEAVMALIMFME